jgi:peptidoglycan/LPS O-acetylase OafA/YrhL
VFAVVRHNWGGSSGAGTGALATFVGVVLSLLVGYASYRWVERPFLRRKAGVAARTAPVRSI